MRWTACVALAATLLPGDSEARGGGPEVLVLSSLSVARPRHTEARLRAARIEAARGEWESFQVVVRAGAQPISSLSMRSQALRGPPGPRAAGGFLIPQQLARVAFVDVKVPSNIEGATGPWPDPLIPDIDRFVSERRAAFPARVEAGSDLTVWVDVYVPRDAPPGRYQGSIFVESGGDIAQSRDTSGNTGTTQSGTKDSTRKTRRNPTLLLAQVPVELIVHRFTLPATSSLPVTFGFAATTAARGHYGRAPTPPEALTLARLYSLAALRNRISLHGGTFDSPRCTVDAAGTAHLDSGAYDQEVGPFLDGSADPGGPADGARWTAFDLRLPTGCGGPAGFGSATAAPCLRALAAHIAERGWSDRVFDYTADEPPDAHLPAVRERAAFIARSAPGLLRLVTRPAAPALDGAVDIWCPVVNLVDSKPGAPSFGSAPVARADYAERLGRGQRLWWYQSCLSHGCDIVGGRWFTGWPSLVVDAPPVAHRIFEWLSFRYQMGGELYYNTVEAWADGDPFRDIHRHGGNGDGTLFYPGRPDIIGGRTHIPVESIRLKRIRDGLEDYEYLTLLERSGPDGKATADRLARSIAERAWAWQSDPERLLAVRAEIARRLDALSPP